MSRKPPRRVLQVEDDPLDLELIERCWRRAAPGVQVVTARDGERSLEILGGEPSPAKAFGLVLLDLRMPGIGGFGVLEACRERPREDLPPIVVFSSSSADADVARAYRLGAASYLVKPDSLEVLEEVIRRAARFWLEVNVLPG